MTSVGIAVPVFERWCQSFRMRIRVFILRVSKLEVIKSGTFDDVVCVVEVKRQV